MNDFIEKTSMALSTYCNAFRGIRNQYNPEKIKHLQSEKLKKLINYSYNNIKYYKELFDSNNLRPSDIKSVKDIEKIPILSKQQLRERFWDFLPGKLGPCRVSRTSGSTGVPVCLLSDSSSKIHNSAAVIRYRKALGLPIIGKQILALGKRADEPNKKPYWTFLQGIHKTYYINPYKTSDKDIENTREIINKLKNPAIIAITPAIKALAYLINDKLIEPIKPACVLTIGEYINKQLRDFLDEVFKVKVTDIYACNEAGDVAFQCKRAEGYHISADNCIVEIVNGNTPVETGSKGEVVITNLNRFSMPIIRYKNGDIASLSDSICQCGCRLPLIEKIYGRTGEDLVFPDGSKAHWNLLKGAMNHNHIRQFQIVQNPNGSITVKHVLEKDVNQDEIIKLLRFRFSSVLPCSVKLEFENVSNITPAASGKSKLVISNYKPDKT